jgi:hypothetical protein
MMTRCRSWPLRGARAPRRKADDCVSRVRPRCARRRVRRVATQAVMQASRPALRWALLRGAMAKQRATRCARPSPVDHPGMAMMARRGWPASSPPTIPVIATNRLPPAAFERDGARPAGAGRSRWTATSRASRLVAASCEWRRLTVAAPSAAGRGDSVSPAEISDRSTRAGRCRVRPARLRRTRRPDPRCAPSRAAGIAGSHPHASPSRASTRGVGRRRAPRRAARAH